MLLLVKLEQPPRTKLTLKDVCDEFHVPVYRPYRGQQIPVYKDVRGLAAIDNRTPVHDRVWQSWIPDDPRVAHLLLSIHEMKSERQRWIRSISLQTTDPANE